MLLFDFVNSYVVYFFFLLTFSLAIYAIFKKREFIIEHKKKIFIIAIILLSWTQIARYIGVFFKEDTEWSFWIFNFRILAFKWTTHLPFYVCRLSVVVLLYYAITKDKRVESFLFYWGATGIAGILYPNGEISNIVTLTETFYIDHFVLGLAPYFLLAIQGYKPIKKDLFIITGVMFVLLMSFIPINYFLNQIPNIDGVFDYFYVIDQSIFRVIFPGQSSVLFVIVHTVTALGFFSLYYFMFKNKKYKFK